MTTLVSENPHSSCKEALENSVESPSSTSEGIRLNEGSVVVEDVECRSKVKEIPGHIRKGLDVAALIAVSRNSISNLLHGEIRKLELVA